MDLPGGSGILFGDGFKRATGYRQERFIEQAGILLKEKVSWQ